MALYGAPSLGKRPAAKLNACQRVMAIRMVRGYRTISREAASLLAGLPPWDLEATVLARVSPLCGPPGGHGGTHGRGVPRFGRAQLCPCGGYRRRRPLAPGPGSGHGPERGGVACGRLLLRSSNAREGGC
ncbi:hypothetical protein PYW07_000837 [Mythimna separata]|uniref:Uncharacterized protein n=1 Tax=Mythimna separata TaxID=271217 RepID=A0AAD7YSD8_MYTSE|nr:hypothetical protein PYW07_000837 [Mythimna separata]